MRLHVATSPAWVETALRDMDSFLQDHATCERKASATALVLVSRFRDDPETVEDMIELAREELEHYHQVWGWLRRRGLTLPPDEKDEYVNRLAALCRTGRRDHNLDRLLVGGIIEARGTERFGLLANALPPGELKDFYVEIARSEARHHGLFTRVARRIFGDRATRERLEELLAEEARILQSLPIRAAVH